MEPFLKVSLNTIGVSYIYEKIYLSQPVRPMQKLEESLKALYMAVLTALAQASGFDNQHTFSKLKFSRLVTI